MIYLATFALVVGIVVLGLYIGYQAYRGFRRHESGPMWYLSIGLILLTAVGSTFAFLTWLLGAVEIIPEALGPPLYLVYRVVQFVGLCFIAYSLYRRP